MELEELHFADDSADDPYEIILLPETNRKIASHNRLSPAHACLPLKGLSIHSDCLSPERRCFNNCEYDKSANIGFMPPLIAFANGVLFDLKLY
ncbi:hypothetical protein CDAR_577631 [Caerostris darwini]|uniref:Uncharacterized protein n=1 Tax=Caerostris darwini TaxID=1538125 RepID=A0AAV4URQ2_9ARAC|nr:hypothetical protein CDAR_577631 [Caerostris darwini]